MTATVAAAPAATPAGTPLTPGYAAMPIPSAPAFPAAYPVGGAPPPPAAGPALRAGRLRVRNPDGSESTRAVSPTGRAANQATSEWINEFNLGTISHQNRLFRIIPDRYLEGSFAMN